MNKLDALFIAGLTLLFLPFFVFREFYDFYVEFNSQHSIIMSFVKFSILATLGEVIGLRIKTGEYYKKGFGIVPRMLVWGFLGITIKMAFVIFAAGTPVLLQTMGDENAIEAFKGPFTTDKVFVAFCISVMMNIIYAPVMMTFHRLTDMHILETNGTIKGFFTPINFNKLFVNLNWRVQWNFVFKKTIPFFWIPAHTITFLLPPDYQVLFAALLGIALGVILAIADVMGDANPKTSEI